VDTTIHEFSMAARDADGHEYRARAKGRGRADGTWIGWIEFELEGAGGVVRRTPRETTQPSREALLYWALGIDEVYLDGALARAAVASAI
jgi:hypothetical protein